MNTPRLRAFVDYHRYFTSIEPRAIHTASPSKLLYFSVDSVLNSTLSYRTDVSYVVESHSDATHVTTTEIQKGMDTAPYVVVTTGSLFSDKVSINGETAVRINKWLSPLKTFAMFPVKFEQDGGVYIWRCQGDGQLILYEGVDSHTPIAWFQRSRRRLVNNLPTVHPASLALQPAAVKIQDIVVASFLILEHKRRTTLQKRSNSKILPR
ncbi:hypothetical protein PLEOSDRAFT_1101158 [Pleurotus ostreatus PC15]|uniref:DUF6593 domain-containing protein n=2 Tax=Pleurotus TaxID=5320 RepID=A0A067NQ05_PLEO1|nr:hypothetical protein CCMSSC00406_0009258 [Pleurotus cornucopiae]KDQ30153.1 hypothetical protein PLEOSDRAFT_1101158 [Pleurotus ostreatus PC15]